jgi:hypothetical protein
MWPARHHNQYKKDGNSSLGHAKPVIVMPFEERDEYTVTLAHTPPPPFDGIELDARELPVEISEGSYTKTLDGLGSQFLGKNEPGSFIRFTLPEIEPGRYEISGDFVLASVYGIVRVLFDGEQIGGEFDAYCDGVDAEGFVVSFGEVEIGAGEHTLTDDNGIARRAIVVPHSPFPIPCRSSLPLHRTLGCGIIRQGIFQPQPR